jgi:hypothetical protein
MFQFDLHLLHLFLEPDHQNERHQLKNQLNYDQDPSPPLLDLSRHEIKILKQASLKSRLYKEFRKSCLNRALTTAFWKAKSILL